jgi:hypothetical protein
MMYSTGDHSLLSSWRFGPPFAPAASTTAGVYLFPLEVDPLVFAVAALLSSISPRIIRIVLDDTWKPEAVEDILEQALIIYRRIK